MKYITLSIMLMISYFCVIEAMPKSLIITESDITKVKVYQTGATIEREAEVKLVKGLTTIEFKGLPKILDTKSLMISKTGDTNVLILDYNFFNEEYNDSTIKKYDNEIVLLEQQTRLLKQRLKTYFERTEFYEGIETGINSGIVKNYTVATHKETSKIESYLFNEKIKENEKINVLTDSINTMKNRLERIVLKRDSVRYIPKQTLAVNVKCSSAGNNTFTIKYLISNAGWHPFYNLDIHPKTDKSQLDMLATIYQETGEDWNDVHISVSNEAPAQVQSIPRLKRIGLSEKYHNSRIGTGIYKQGRSAHQNKPGVDETFRDFNIKEFNVIEEKKSFELARAYTLNSGERDLKIKLESKILISAYEDRIELNKGNMIRHIVSIHNSSNQSFKDGNVNLFLDGEFKGKDKMANLSPDDILSLSLYQILL